MRILISKNFNSKISRLIEKGILSSKEEAVEVACTLGLIYNEKKTIEDRVALELDSFDENKIFAVIASARNPKLITEQEVISELEKYIESGSLRLDEKFDFYEVYDSIKKLDFGLF
ncbi:MAG: hypothetical protein QME47_02105 [Candidatus Thermoplasmatota archaeon]|nr:hypothetical protein [Candidatus Thermoplasmatota archaeon]